jgi:hypothetical protein
MGLLVFLEPVPIFAFIGILVWVLPYLAGVLIYRTKRTVQLDKLALGAPDNTDLQSDVIRSRHKLLMFQLTSFWFGCCIMVSYSIFFLKLGLKEQWFIFTRTEFIGKHHPLFMWTIFDQTLLYSGFFALTGLLWLPMYFFFEGLEVKRKIKLLEAGQPSNA